MTVTQAPVLLRDQAYRSLQRDIQTGVLAPGTIVRDVEIAAQLGCSRAPVRDALLRLAAEGLVETKAKAYTQVSPLNLDRAVQCIPVVTALRIEAARAAATRITDAQIDELAALNDRYRELAEDGADLDALLDITDRFHRLWVGAADNVVLAESLGLVEPYLYRSLRLGYTRGATSNSVFVADIRARLVTAFRRRDPDAAAEAERDNCALFARILGVDVP